MAAPRPEIKQPAPRISGDAKNAPDYLFLNGNFRLAGIVPGALEMMILRTLKRQPLHGYALVQHIKRTSNDLLQIEEGSLYPALQRLLKDDLVKAEWGISSTNRRVRIYKLTAAGSKHLEREVSSFERMLDGITRVLAPGEL